MVKKLTEGVHVGLLKYLDMGEKLDDATTRKYRRYLWCRLFHWTPDEYDRQPASVLHEFEAFMMTESKLRDINGR